MLNYALGAPGSLRLVDRTGIDQFNMLKITNMSDGKRNVTLPCSLSSSDVSPIEKHVELNKLKERPTPLKKGNNILVTQSVKRCLQQETTYEGKILCNTCNKRKSESCDILSRKYSEEERKFLKKSRIMCL